MASSASVNICPLCLGRLKLRCGVKYTYGNVLYENYSWNRWCSRKNTTVVTKTMIILNEITGWRFYFFLFIFDKDYYGLQHETS